MAERKETSSSRSNIFKSLDLSMNSKGGNSLPPETPRSSRMEEALQLRQALQGSASCLNRRHLVGAMASPKKAFGTEKENQNQFEDMDEDEYNEDFEVASFRGERKKGEDGTTPHTEIERSSGRAAILARLEFKSGGQGPVIDEKGSISSKAFKDQLSARFKSTAQPARRMASTDSNEDGQN